MTANRFRGAVSALTVERPTTTTCFHGIAVLPTAAGGTEEAPVVTVFTGAGTVLAGAGVVRAGAGTVLTGAGVVPTGAGITGLATLAVRLGALGFTDNSLAICRLPWVWTQPLGLTETQGKLAVTPPPNPPPPYPYSPYVII